MKSDEAISVFIADDHAMVREGLAAIVSKDPQVEVVGQCGNGLAVFNLVAKHRPDVILLDISMPGLNGLDSCRELTRRHAGGAVLILTMHNDDQFVARALENGASGYLLKEAAATQLLQAVHAVANGELYLGPGISSSVVSCMSGRDKDPYNTLTTRERQVLQLVAEGKTNRKVAKELDLAVKTVDTHRTRLMRKLSIHNQTALVKYALKKGLITLR